MRVFLHAVLNEPVIKPTTLTVTKEGDGCHHAQRKLHVRHYASMHAHVLSACETYVQLQSDHTHMLQVEAVIGHYC